MKVFLASANGKKILEMQRILAEAVPDVEVLGIADVEGYVEPVEDQPTFAGNALLKARAGVAATGMPSVADDSGLCVDALNGMPGVLSARWSGPPKSDARNNQLLLDQLHDVPDERRGAHFACAVAWVMPDGRERVVEGRMDGRIIREPRGSGGFGYDVLFVAVEHDAEGLTSAELDPAEKDRISHRGRALRELVTHVAADLSGD
ncbi:RdgB/HAM1 family non-canonical purine NTP pyrophosphatase [Nocardioides sp. S-58]|uniref:dITP/XTP pyrophosphatase n=1 Tax=Nocardioides renjunii TaxID=3095075 RepID=A0ABU5K729_9ACTN|nr:MULTISPECIES: RdgB/HAM1 family non-canonical purine NTP pyrophosphatase [unclassified Nocardioides]MDZ5660235.1 RdgB/HAM1 family non-canonical purine NTP pyrophosphatase [Nocardioides sp. S-58]WQQ21245.1 RdgB/HAM1 family non-canonical purine NTP pyrophosphatase [Nocardioides sp. S-34]